jgi:hypothetical protein
VRVMGHVLDNTRQHSGSPKTLYCAGAVVSMPLHCVSMDAHLLWQRPQHVLADIQVLQH